MYTTQCHPTVLLLNVSSNLPFSEPTAARIRDCHIKLSVEPDSVSSSRYIYSCLVPDNVNSNYDVHVISVNWAFNSRTAHVSLTTSGEVLKPIILVLASREPVQWLLGVPSGMEIERVHLVSIHCILKEMQKRLYAIKFY